MCVLLRLCGCQLQPSAREWSVCRAGVCYVLRRECQRITHHSRGACWRVLWWSELALFAGTSPSWSCSLGGACSRTASKA
eukprot:2986665-Rhodomonas_salina.1